MWHPVEAMDSKMRRYFRATYRSSKSYGFRGILSKPLSQPTNGKRSSMIVMINRYYHYIHFSIGIFSNINDITIWLVVYLPLWKKYESVGMIIPNMWKNKSHVPNHQPDCNMARMIIRKKHKKDCKTGTSTESLRVVISWNLWLTMVLNNPVKWGENHPESWRHFRVLSPD